MANPALTVPRPIRSAALPPPSDSGLAVDCYRLSADRLPSTASPLGSSAAPRLAASAPPASYLTGSLSLPAPPAPPPPSIPRTWTHSTRERSTPPMLPAGSPNILPNRLSLNSLQPMALPPAAGSSSGSDSGSNQQRQPGLIRRVSQKAANKLRRRTSSTSHDPDERSGPVLMRHRSGSLNTSSDTVRMGLSQGDGLDEDDGLAITDILDQVDGELGEEAGELVAGPEPSDGIVIPKALELGTSMYRVTRKKKVQRTFRLDVNTAKVSWDPSKPSSRFYVDDMKEIRTGADARNYREEFQISADCEDRWITIRYADPEDRRKFKTLHLIAPTREYFHIWTETLEKIHRYRTNMMAGLASQGEKFVDAHWRNYMASQHAANPKLKPIDERLSLEDVERLCRRLHVNCSRKYLKEKFKRADRDNSGYLNFMEFRRFVKLLKEREEIKTLFREHVANPDAGMYRHEFRGFLRDVQKVEIDADSEYIDKIFRKFCKQSSKAQKGRLSVPHSEELHEMRISQETFADFLLSSYNPPLIASHQEPNLNRPLNEYFVSSSHNTYLMGRQVRGESSVEGYIKVLQRGCRSVEIDCWDGDDGRPVVTHGRTGTSTVLFSDVLSAIAKYAFMASPYPLVLSLEVHCCLEQQVKMAELLRVTFGDKLVTKPYMSNALVLPSPQDLKHRILVKVKGNDRAETPQLSDAERRSDNEMASPRIAKALSSSSTQSSSETDSDSIVPKDKQQQKKVPTKIAQELGALGVYCRGQKFRNFALPESKRYNHIFSFGEKSFVKFCKDADKKAALEKHNVRYLMRVYPSQFRVNSSNFDPLGFWRRGVQMAALNWQTYDLGMQINEAMFASSSDHTGYVLKPKELRGSASALDTNDTAKAKKDKKQVKFSIEVISAQQLSRPKDHRIDDPIDPFVEVEVFSADDKMKGGSTGEGGLDTSSSKGSSGLGAPQKRRTKVVKDDGFHPVFNDTMSFTLVTKFEGLVFVRFSIFTADGIDASDPSKSSKQLIATYTAKLVSLQQGYRHLPLYDIQGEQYLFSTLFVKINVEPFTIMDREIPLKTSAIESIKTTVGSVFSRGRSASIRNKMKRSSSQEKGSEKERKRSGSREKGKGNPSKSPAKDDSGKAQPPTESNDVPSTESGTPQPQNVPRHSNVPGKEQGHGDHSNA